MSEFMYHCALTGVADFVHRKANRAPKWMDNNEKRAWALGYDYARELVV